MKPEFKYLPDVWRVYHFVNLKFTVVRAATPFSLLLPSFSLPFSPFRFSILLNLPIVSMGLLVLFARAFFFLLPLCFLFLNVARLARYAEPSVLFLLSRLCFSCVTSVTLHCVLDFLSLSLSLLFILIIVGTVYDSRILRPCLVPSVSRVDQMLPPLLVRSLSAGFHVPLGFRSKKNVLLFERLSEHDRRRVTRRRLGRFSR